MAAQLCQLVPARYVVRESGKIESAGYDGEMEWGIGGTLLPVVRPRESAGESAGVPDPVFVKSFQGCFQMAKDRAAPFPYCTAPCSIMDYADSFRLSTLMRPSFPLTGLDAEMAAILDFEGLTHQLRDEFQSRLEKRGSAFEHKAFP